MKNKPIRRKRYRAINAGLRQEGDTVILSSQVTRRVAKLLHLKAQLDNTSVSALIGQILEGRFKHLP
jgi:hypothetical protein